jgi:hypothetical protein
MRRLSRPADARVRRKIRPNICGPTGTEATWPFITTRLPRADALHFPQRHQQHTILAESDDFCHHRAMAALTGDLADLPD